MKVKGPYFSTEHPLIITEEMNCSRESYLDLESSIKVFDKERQLCQRRRTESGFATIMDMQFEKKGEV